MTCNNYLPETRLGNACRQCCRETSDESLTHLERLYTNKALVGNPHSCKQEGQNYLMSGTIDPPENEDERRDLESAVIEAVNADMLIFCSAIKKELRN